MGLIADMEVKPQEVVVSSNNSKQDGIKEGTGLLQYALFGNHDTTVW